MLIERPCVEAKLLILKATGLIGSESEETDMERARRCKRGRSGGGKEAASWEAASAGVEQRRRRRRRCALLLPLLPWLVMAWQGLPVAGAAEAAASTAQRPNGYCDEAASIRLCMAVTVRHLADAEDLLETLQEWKRVAGVNCVAVGIDESDSSVELHSAVFRAMDHNGIGPRNRWVLYQHIEQLGQQQQQQQQQQQKMAAATLAAEWDRTHSAASLAKAQTEMMREVTFKFPNATHVLAVLPPWRPRRLPSPFDMRSRCAEDAGSSGEDTCPGGDGSGRGSDARRGDDDVVDMALLWATKVGTVEYTNRRAAETAADGDDEEEEDTCHVLDVQLRRLDGTTAVVPAILSINCVGSVDLTERNLVVARSKAASSGGGKSSSNGKEGAAVGIKYHLLPWGLQQVAAGSGSGSGDKGGGRKGQGSGDNEEGTAAKAAAAAAATTTDGETVQTPPPGGFQLSGSIVTQTIERWRESALSMTAPSSSSLAEAAAGRRQEDEEKDRGGGFTCEPFSRFSLLFLGPTAPITTMDPKGRPQVLAALQQMAGVADDQRLVEHEESVFGHDWRVLSQYALASFLVHVEKVPVESEAVTSLYRSVLSTPPAARYTACGATTGGDASRANACAPPPPPPPPPPPHARSGANAPPPRLLVATVATEVNEQLLNLLRSLRASHVEASAVHVLGLGLTYTDHGVKQRLYRAFVEDVVHGKEGKGSSSSSSSSSSSNSSSGSSGSGHPDQVVLLLDAYDTLVFPNAADLVARLEALEAEQLEQRKATAAAVSDTAAAAVGVVLTAGERRCWPDEGIAPLYPGEAAARARAAAIAVAVEEQQVQPYVNSGVLLGRAVTLLGMYDAMDAHGPVTTCGDDQRALTRVALAGAAATAGGTAAAEAAAAAAAAGGGGGGGVSVAIDAIGDTFMTFHGMRSVAYSFVGRALPTAAAAAAAAGRGAERGPQFTQPHTQLAPAVLHFNGADGKEVYGPFVKAWEEAVTKMGQAQLLALTQEQLMLGVHAETEMSSSSLH